MIIGQLSSMASHEQEELRENEDTTASAKTIVTGEETRRLAKPGSLNSYSPDSFHVLYCLYILPAKV